MQKLSNYKTSNPAFSNYFWETMSVRGIIVKSMVCILIIAVITAFVWKLFDNGINVRWFTIGGMLAAIVISIVISVRQHWAHFLVPLYAVAKGCFLGGFSAFIKAKFPELPFQAIGVTIVTFFTILVLYQTRIIVVTKKIRSVIITAAFSIFIVYLISFSTRLVRTLSMLGAGVSVSTKNCSK